ncbi:unnamed protein product [Somion occarium]|uniref:Alginate lyase domain-containing protein n=1 Tax=Somion occarium TaxID=3059160 RepID=A0ABP1CN41_9APHY
MPALLLLLPATDPASLSSKEHLDLLFVIIFIMPFTALPVFAFLAAATAGFAAEPNDWINVNYILQQAGGGSSFTSFSQKTIISKAGSTAKDGPWTIMSKTGVKPPSGDVHDYLSWAPYHWPDCNWCTKGTKQIANPNATSGEPDDGAGDVPEEDAPDDSAHEESLDFGEIFPDYFVNTQQNVARTDHRMRRVKRATSICYDLRDVDLPLPIVDDPPPPEPALTPPFAVPTSQPTQGTTRTNKPVAGTPSPAQAAAKGKEKDTKAACTPSPTKSLAPSATWTTCPYVVRDGKVNPDVRTLPGSSAAQDMPESVLFNALTYAFSKSGTTSQNVGKFVDAFFLTSSTAMHPNLNFGQLVRGPGKDHQIGTFTGPLDMRGLVKVVNAIQLMKALKGPDWTSARDQALMSWMKTYIGWLQNSDLGKEVAGKANNHLSFYVSQLSAAQVFVGDSKGATNTIQNYFMKQFKDQIAQSGEQPFEAVRTRPYHYRAFNLEAMITNAKIADQLGVNVWTTKSKYGATIQTALDYAMAQDPDGEDVTDILPHVAAVAAAYGDPKGKYNAFLKKQNSNYKSESYWFYDQTAALPNSPAAGKQKRAIDGNEDVPTSSANDTSKAAGDTVASETKIIPFECPDVFSDAKKVEIEDGLFVTCDELAPYYKLPALSDI